jgi:hypothetical protein
MHLKLVAPGVIFLASSLTSVSSVHGTPAHAKKEKRACTFCPASQSPKNGKAGNNNNQGSKTVPEPSQIPTALVLVGGSALLLRRRGKK